jgi:membrane protein YqaA with SNARE-associated domain
MKKKKSLYVFLFILSTILLFLPLFFKQFFTQASQLGLIGIFLINFFSSATLFLPAPAFISVAVGGHLYNPFLVALLASLGSSLGEGTGFLFGYSSQKTIGFSSNHKVLYHLAKFIFEKYGTVLIFLFSLIPNPVFDGIGIFAGISSYSTKRFFVVVFLGRFLRNLVISYFGGYV